MIGFFVAAKSTEILTVVKIDLAVHLWCLSDKIPLPVKELQVRSLSGEDPLKEEMATSSSILAWEIP